MQILVIRNDFIKAVFLDYGAILHELWVTSASGQTINVIKGLANPEDYREDEWWRGALIGRFAGRLSESYSIDGTIFHLYHTDGVLLHSGDKGWGKQFWKLEHHNQKELTLSHICQARNSGFPGTVKGQITYKLNGKKLHLEYKATTNVNAGKASAASNGSSKRFIQEILHEIVQNIIPINNSPIFFGFFIHSSKLFSVFLPNRGVILI